MGFADLVEGLDQPDIEPMCRLFAQWSDEAESLLKPFVKRYGERREGEPERLDKALKGVLKPERSHMADYIGLLDESEKRLDLPQRSGAGGPRVAR
jgi:hypothetical protein